MCWARRPLSSLLTGMLFGLAPALESTRADVARALKEARAWALRCALVAGCGLGRFLSPGKIAMSLLMLVAAGPFVKTLSNLQSVDLGFNRENVLLFELNAGQADTKARRFPHSTTVSESN